MKVFDLRCSKGHGFEGWFASENAFVDQQTRGLVECPLCGDHAVTRMPSAPRLNLSAAEQPAKTSATTENAGAASTSVAMPDLQAAWLQAVRQVIAQTEDVGEKFTEEARRIHYGESPNRGIRGAATAQQRAELLDEGIEVVAFPLPRGIDGPLQ
ncbi:MAG: DUF1178 family protein [Burkholderiaceae bacterium]|nr:DUF1178 family protein [Burkholderiaceae bacterium]